ncbi:MAG: flagellin [Phycisphaerae bacterium]|nr:flagellin [Phycisphaerae bacterium]
MARINTNVGAVTAQRYLNSSYEGLNGTLERLSTGLRINSGKDDPAGLIVSERLRSEISAVNQAITNSQRASNIIATAEGALDEVAALLLSIQEKVVEAANTGALSDEEIEANQLQIDDAIASITRIANTTSFAGRNLIDGSLSYVTSGISSDAIDALAVYRAQFGTRPYIPVNIEVTQSAQPAALLYPFSTVPDSVTIEIQGKQGTTTLSFVSGTSAAKIASAINALSDATGVCAILSSTPAAGFQLISAEVGSRQFVGVTVLPGGGTFNVTDTDGVTVNRTIGRDATATINGAMSTGDGNALTLKTSSLDLELTLDETFGLGTTSFAITSGGALFQIGPRVNSSLQVGVGINSVAASRLGNQAIGYLSQIVTGEDYSVVGGNAMEASQIVDEAIAQVSVLRGRLGAFEKNTLDTNMNQLGITAENLTASESTIRDADFAYESSQLSRNQVLISSGTTVLGLANQVPQSVLQLLA